MVTWGGNDREEFTAFWTQSVRPILLASSTSLNEAALSAQKNAHDQELASTAETVGTPGLRPPGTDLAGDGSGPSPMTALGGPAPAKPPKKPKRDLNEILRKYQVTDGTVIDWQPPWPASMGIKPEKITAKEGDMLNGLVWRTPSYLPAFRDCKAAAEDIADVHFPAQGKRDGHNDAFRHAMWNAKLVREFGPEWAKEFTTAHEQMPGGAPQSEAMDLYNNEMGRRIAINYPDASDEELAEHIKRAIDKGDLLVINQDGKLAYSNQVKPGETGLTEIGQGDPPDENPKPTPTRPHPREPQP